MLDKDGDVEQNWDLEVGHILLSFFLQNDKYGI